MINDVEIVWVAIKQNPLSIKWAGDVPRDNYDIMRYIVERDNRMIIYASQRLKDNIDFAMIAMGDPVAMMSIGPNAKLALGIKCNTS